MLFALFVLSLPPQGLHPLQLNGIFDLREVLVKHHVDTSPRQFLIIQVVVAQGLIEVVVELLIHHAKHIDVPLDLLEVLDARENRPGPFP